jgi:hypothetical protein
MSDVRDDWFDFRTRERTVDRLTVSPTDGAPTYGRHA